MGLVSLTGIALAIASVASAFACKRSVTATRRTVSLSLLVPPPSAVAVRSIRPRRGVSRPLAEGPDTVPFALVPPRAAGEPPAFADSLEFLVERLPVPLLPFIAMSGLPVGNRLNGQDRCRQVSAEDPPPDPAVALCHARRTTWALTGSSVTNNPCSREA